MVSAVGMIVVASNLPGSFSSLGFLIFPAMAAALIGAFRSLSLAMVGGVLVGVVEAVSSYRSTWAEYRGGRSVSHRAGRFAVDSAPRGVGCGALISPGWHPSGCGTLIPPSRPRSGCGALIWSRPPCMSRPRLWWQQRRIRFGCSYSPSALITAVVAVSVGVIYDNAGLLSLCQMSFAGVGAWTVGWLNLKTSLPYLAMLPIAALVPFAVGILVGIPRPAAPRAELGRVHPGVQRGGGPGGVRRRLSRPDRGQPGAPARLCQQRCRLLLVLRGSPRACRPSCGRAAPLSHREVVVLGAAQRAGDCGHGPQRGEDQAVRICGQRGHCRAGEGPCWSRCTGS